MPACCTDALYSSRHKIKIPFISAETYIYYNYSEDYLFQVLELKYFGRKRSIAQAISYCPFCGKKLEKER